MPRLCVCAVGLLLAVAVGSPGLANAVPAPAIHAVSKVSWKSAPTPRALRYIASHDGLVITDGYPLADHQLPVLHGLNPSLRIVPYVMGLERSPDDHIAPGWCAVARVAGECPNAGSVVDPARHPDWFLRDASGSLIIDPACGNGHNCFLMNPADRAWIAWRTAELQWWVRDEGYDGVYVDGVWPALSDADFDQLPIDPRTGKVYADAQWATDVRAFLVAMKQAIGPGKWLVVNSLLSGSQYAARETAEMGYLQAADAALEEGFIEWSNQPTPRSEADWLKDVQSIAAVTGAGKIPIGWTARAIGQTAAQVRRLERYSLASYLLGAGDGARRYYTFQEYQPSPGAADPCANQCQLADPAWSVPLGEPTGPYYRQAGVYRRDYSNGTVLVNPSDNAAQAIALAGTYKTPGGQALTGITLGPRTGAILGRVSTHARPLLAPVLVGAALAALAAALALRRARRRTRTPRRRRQRP